MPHKSHTGAFIRLSLMLALCTSIFLQAQRNPERCKSANISAKYQHCRTHAEGVRDLDCFGKYLLIGKKRCVWKPGSGAWAKNYTLVVQQGKYCRLYGGVTGFLQDIDPFTKNITAQVFENSDSTNCTRAVFRGFLNLTRCGPPSHVTFSRQSGRLDVNVTWQQEDVRTIKQFSVRYKTLGGGFWSESAATTSHNGERCTVENLNSSLVYLVQVQCVTNKDCTQCPWSHTYTVPAELTAEPANITLQDDDVAEQRGSRVITLTWVFPSTERADGYLVTVSKASGEEPPDLMRTARPEARLVLSYTAHRVSVSAFNNASVSSAANRTIPERADDAGAGNLNVTVLSNTSFTIYWKDNLIETYVCYCAEWRTKGHHGAYKSFYQDLTNSRTLTGLEPLEPYKRYTITLHKRTNNDTCNLKRVNNTESTYASARFYLAEGSPLAAPANITVYNATLSSVALRWSAIPEDDVRGFLLGYTIHYAEYKYRETLAETSITVDPESNSYELTGLKRGTAYRVQISGFTRVGAGVRSTASFFKTNQKDYFTVTVLIAISIIVIILAILGSHVIKRVKDVLWPSIPNPGNSNTMQNMEGPFEMELLNSINTPEVEEWDTNSLQIIEERPLIPVSKLPSVLSLLYDSENKDYAPNMRCVWIQRNADDTPEDVAPDVTADAFSDPKQTSFQNPFCALSSDYTTMEMLQQAGQIVQTVDNKLDGMNLGVANSGLDYIKQSGAWPNYDSEEILL